MDLRLCPLAHSIRAVALPRGTEVLTRVDRLGERRIPQGSIGRVTRIDGRIGEELARRWVKGDPGPFGSDAPAAPEVVWSE